MHVPRDRLFNAELGSRCYCFSDCEALELAIRNDSGRLADVFAARIVVERDLVVDTDPLDHCRDQ